MARSKFTCGSRRLRRTVVQVLVVLALAAGAGGGAAAAQRSPLAARPNGLCELLDVVLRIDCDPPPHSPQRKDSQSTNSSPVLPERPARQTSVVARYDPGRLTVTFRAGIGQQRIDALFAKAGVTPEQAMPQIRAYMVGVPPDRRSAALAALRDSSLVASAGREPLVDALTVTPDDELWPQQWGLQLTGFPEAWSRTRGSSHVIVAVLDTGVDLTQRELRGAFVPGYDFVNGDADPSDDEGHGTSVAGIIAARGNKHLGVAGVCWSCSIMPVKVLDAQGSGVDSVIAAGIIWAADHGARVINLSLGGPGVSQDLHDAIAYAVGKNAVVVAAAGNSGTSDRFYPAADPLAISVAGTTAADKRYSWSNFGPWVLVAAPGCNVAPVRGGRDEFFCGTSSAAPVVSGLAALALSTNPTATPADIAQAVERAAVPVPGVVQFGRINAPRTLSLISAAQTVQAGRVFTGRLGARASTRAFSLQVASGAMTATLTFKGSRTLSLALTSVDGTPLARAAGPSPLRLEQAVPAGTIRLVVSGAKRASFVLSVSYSRSAG
jgi:subtilisin family serine protease